MSTTALTENWDVSRHPPELRAKAAEVFPRAQQSLSDAIEAGVKIACGSDAPAIWHGRNAEELLALVKRGMSPLQAIRATIRAGVEDREIGLGVTATDRREPACRPETSSLH